MDLSTQRSRAESFRDLHTQTSSTPLVLPNAWDCASALLFEGAGFDAIGTTSAGIAAVHGVPDGECLSRDQMLAAVERIADCVEVPVSADIEAGYGTGPSAVADTVRKTIAAGAVGVNLEDGVDSAANPLLETRAHAELITAARDVAEEEEVPLVINGRTDVFWRSVGPADTRLERAVERCNTYIDAGSDCVFVPGVSDLDTIEALAAETDGPLNVLGGPGVPSVSSLGDVGVARVSVGSGPVRAALGVVASIATELRTAGRFDEMADGLPYDALNDLLRTAVRRQTE